MSDWVPQLMMPERAEGYLMKQGNVVKNWKKRYFCVELDKITYAKKKGDKPIGFIPLGAPITVMKFDNDEGEKNICAFRIKTPKRIYRLEASSSAEMEEWVRLLNKNIEFMVDNPVIGRSPVTSPSTSPRGVSETTTVRLTSDRPNQSNDNPLLVSMMPTNQRSTLSILYDQSKGNGGVLMIEDKKARCKTTEFENNPLIMQIPEPNSNNNSGDNNSNNNDNKSKNNQSPNMNPKNDHQKLANNNNNDKQSGNNGSGSDNKQQSGGGDRKQNLEMSKKLMKSRMLLNNLDSSESKLKEKINRLLAEFEATNEELHDEIKSLSTQRDQDQKTITHLKLVCDQKDQMIRQLRTELEVKSQHSKIERDTSKPLSSVEEELERLQEKMEAYRSQNALLSADVDRLEKENNILKSATSATSDVLHSELSDYRKAFQNYKKKLAIIIATYNIDESILSISDVPMDVNNQSEAIEFLKERYFMSFLSSCKLQKLLSGQNSTVNSKQLYLQAVKEKIPFSDYESFIQSKIQES